MAQAETIDVPTSPLPPSQPAKTSAPSQPHKPDELPIEIVSHTVSSNGSQEQRQTTTNALENQDDEVQFVFSVPRRRKKKRKRLGSSYNLPNASQVSKTPGDAPSGAAPSTSTPSQKARRRSTGMVQQLESCHLSGRIPDSAKSGSLPAITANFQADLTTHPEPACIPSPNMALLPAHSSLLPDLTSWWSKQIPPIQDNDTLEFDWCGMPFADEILKRKHEGEPEEPRPSPAERPQYVQSSVQVNPGFSDPGSSSTVNEGTSDPWSNPSIQDPAEAHIPSATWWPGFLGTPGVHSFIQPQSAYFTAPSSNLNAANHLWRRISRQRSSQSPSSPRSFPNQTWQQQTIQVPASHVPEQSVSPRTKTVQVVRSLDPTQPQHQPSPAATSRSPAVPSSPSRSAMKPNEASLNPNHQGPRQRPHSSSLEFQQIGSTSDRPTPAVEHFRHVHSNPNDILRKPSLYKIPPWPSPQISLHPPQPLITATHSSSSNIRNGISNNARTPIQSLGAQTASSPPVTNGTQTPLGQDMQANSPPSVARLSKSRPTATGQAQVTSSSQIQTSQSTRKHSPNLIVDIAETCQQNFPFAAVAERHKQPIQKVFDTFSAIIQLPLLRSAADHRRHGSLGKRRMKEFRDAKKAMEKAQEQERKRALREEKRAESGDLGMHKKAKKGPGLLKAAILNNAREKEGSAAS